MLENETFFFLIEISLKSETFLDSETFSASKTFFGNEPFLKKSKKWQRKH